MPSSSAQYSVGMPVAGKVLCGLLAASSVVGRIAIPDDIAVKELAANRQLLDSPDPIDEDEDGDAVYIDNSYDDLDGNGIPDAEEDLNGNGVPDGEEDLDGNGIPDGDEDLDGDDGGDGDDEADADGGDEEYADGGDEETDPYADDGGDEEDPYADDGGDEEEDPYADDGGDDEADPYADDGGDEEEDPYADDGGDEEADPDAEDGGDEEEEEVDPDADPDADDEAMPDEVVEVMPTDDVTTTTVTDFPPTPSGQAPVPDEAALAALDPPYIVGVDLEIAPPAVGVVDIDSGTNVPTATDCAVACTADPECTAASWLGANPEFFNPDNCFLKIVEPGCIVPENAVVMAATFLLIQVPEGCVTGSVSLAPGPADEVVTGSGLAPFGATTAGVGPMGAVAPGAVDSLMASMAPTPAAAAGLAPSPAATRDAGAGAVEDPTTSTTAGTDGTTTGTDDTAPSAETVAGSAASVGVAAFTAIAFGAVLAF